MAATTAPAAAGPTSTLQPAMVALPGAAEPAALAGPTAPNSNAPGGLAASVEVPTVAASYQHKPLPPYPPMSKRLGEQGTALVEVWIGSDGLPKQASVRKSSGFERLDKASVDAVMAWRYNPGKRGSTPEAMAMLIPLQWVNQ